MHASEVNQQTNELNINDLGDGKVSDIPADLGKLLEQAGIVCLESQGHSQYATLIVRNESESKYFLVWQPVSKQSRRFWNDMVHATEHGAICIAALLAKHETGYAVIESSRRGAGFDYWLGYASDETLQRKARLEVSGILKGDDNIIRARVRQKLAQIDSDDLSCSEMPAYTIVVEFGKPVAEVHKI